MRKRDHRHLDTILSRGVNYWDFSCSNQLPPVQPLKFTVVIRLLQCCTYLIPLYTHWSAIPVKLNRFWAYAEIIDFRTWYTYCIIMCIHKNILKVCLRYYLHMTWNLFIVKRLQYYYYIIVKWFNILIVCKPMMGNPVLHTYDMKRPAQSMWREKNISTTCT